MKFPVAIHKDEGSVYGVTVPDIPGCHSWGDTLDEALNNTEQAIVGHLQTLQDLSDNFELRASAIENLVGNADYAGAVWALVSVDLARLDTKPERINISVPRWVVWTVDQYASARHETRSGLFARAALELIERERTVA